MKKRLTSYTFDASEKTVTHADFSDVGLAGIQLIVNVTDQIIIYNFADTDKGGTLSTDTLTLEFDTTSMSDTDELMILVEDGTATQVVSGTVTANLSAVDNTVLDNIDADTSAIQTATEAIQTAVEGTLTVEGTVAVTNAGLTELAAAIDTEVQVDVVASLPAGDNNIGNVGLIGRTTGGLSIFRSLDLDESEEEVKGSAGQVFSITAFNTTDAPLYLKFYNATAANTTVGSTTPVLTFLVPGNANSDGAGFAWNNDIGFAFSTAITVAATTAVADADTGAPGANACIINIGYA